MAKLLLQLLAAALAFAATALPLQPATAAGAQGRASAVIKSSISIRTADDPAAGPAIHAAQVDRPLPRTVTRPCRPNDPSSDQRCRLVLLELQ